MDDDLVKNKRKRTIIQNMKKSNKILLGLFALVVSCMVITDYSLRGIYLKINLDDPFKNYETLIVKPFRVLKIKGGSAYSIVIHQTAKTEMKVMSTRKSFLHYSNTEDTLNILFTVPNNQGLALSELPVGLMVGSPNILEIDAEGTSNRVWDWQGDTLKLKQMGTASTSIDKLESDRFTAVGSQNSLLRFQSGNKVISLSLDIRDNAAVFLDDISYRLFNPIMHNQARLIFTAETGERLKQP